MPFSHTSANLPGLIGSDIFGQPIWGSASTSRLAVSCNLPGLLGSVVLGQPVWEVGLPKTSVEAQTPGWVSNIIFGQPIWMIAGFGPVPRSRTANITGLAMIVPSHNLPHRSTVTI